MTEEKPISWKYLTNGEPFSSLKKKIVQRECRAGTAVPRGKVLGLCAGTLSKAASHYDMVFPVCESWTLKKAEH